MKSKLNATGLIISIIGLVAAYDLIPREAEEHMTEIAMMVTGPAVIVFRKYFTGEGRGILARLGWSK